jgi:prophage DNA circulation protein
MTRAENDEAVGVLTVVLNALLGTLGGMLGRPQAAAKLAIGSLQASAAQALNSAQVGTPLLSCFDLCVAAGATLSQMGTVSATVQAQQNLMGLPAVAVAITAVYYSLIEQARLAEQTNFVSRQDVDAMMTVMNNAFDPAEEFAADVTDDPSVYQAIVALHAAVMQDLTTRARPLPQMITYSFSKSMPSLALAQRIYSAQINPRTGVMYADDLVAENKTVHPGFMQRTGRALSF